MSNVIRYNFLGLPAIVGDVLELDFQTYYLGIPVDATTIIVSLTSPNGNVTTFNWPAPATVGRNTIGSYFCNFPVLESGTWSFSITVTGIVNSAVSSQFSVSPLMETVQITINDGINPVSGASVQLFGNLALLSESTTNSSGIAYASIAPGDYSLKISKTKATFVYPELLTIANTAEVGGHLVVQTIQFFTFSGTVLPIQTSGTVKKVKLFGHLIRSDGNAAETRIQVESLGSMSFAVNTGTDTSIDKFPIEIGGGKRELISDSTGYWECDVVADSIVRVTVPDLQYTKVFRVITNTGYMNISDARPDPADRYVFNLQNRGS